MRAISFPLIDDLLEEKSGTLCALSDPPGRLRDGMAVVALTQFCAARNVRLRIQQVPASHRRYVDARILLSRLSSEQQRQIDAMLKSDRTLNEKVAELFRTAEGSRMTAEHSDEVIALEPRGPVIVIGRPQLYPKYFQHAIEAELPEGAGIVGRFEMSEPDVEGTKFWEVHDHYFNLAIPQRRGAQDFAVIRKIHGRYSRRTFLLVYGTSSLGTMAAAQLLIDQDLNEDLSRANVAAALEKYGSAELLVHVNLEALVRRGILAEGPHQAKLWTPELEPHQIQVLAEPAPPVSAEVMNWIRAFEGDTHSGDLQSVYERISADADDLVQYRVTGIHPQAEFDQLGWFMVGGKAVGACVEALQDLAKAERRQPVLLSGPTGSGKELGARIVFQERILHILRRLACSQDIWPAPVVIGACFTEINCAKVTQTLAESEYFGVREKSATDVVGRPGLILEAGEGVAFLDEVSFMELKDQAGLLRAVQPPYGIRSVGFSKEIPSTAQLVAAMSDDPEKLVESGKLLPELCARFRPGTVRLPGLDERPGDIPALLAHLAGGSVRMTGTVLRCLLAGSYPYNVRDLQHVISRAQSRCVPSGPLEITVEALGEPASYGRIAALVEGVARRKDRMFEFIAPAGSSIRGAVFERAARTLTAFANDKHGTIRPRWSKRNEELGLRAESYSITNLEDVAAVLIDALLLIAQEAPKAERDGLLNLLAHLLEERYSAWRREDERKRKKKALATIVKAKLTGSQVTQSDLAVLFGASPSWVSEIAGPKPSEPKGSAKNSRSRSR